MPAPRSVVQGLVVDVAAKKHCCSHNKRHTITSGQKRLKIKVGRSFQTYCITCGQGFIKQGVEQLQNILSQLEQIK